MKITPSKSILDKVKLVCGFVFAAYIISIFLINFLGRIWVDYDIYSDAILSKYMVENRSLFPKDWTFGNQLYIVATPVLAAICYLLTRDSYSALAIASCIMTIAIVACFIWSIGPFVKKKNILVGLLVLIGGLNVEFSAHASQTGLQLFYTMASYYSCYVIGILITIGVYFRLHEGISIKKLALFSVFLYNFALGVQSLRQTLILNIPLCVVVIVELGFKIKDNQIGIEQKKKCLFALGMLLVNLAGYMCNSILITYGAVRQADILEAPFAGIWENIKHTVVEFAGCIGLVHPMSVFTLFKFLAALFSIIILIVTIGCMWVDYKKNNKVTVIGVGVIFFLFSILGVFFAGIVVIRVRDIYFFCWELLIVFCCIYLLEFYINGIERYLNRAKVLFCVLLLGISLLNYACLFGVSFHNYSSTKDNYQDICARLEDRGIKYIYAYNSFFTSSEYAFKGWDCVLCI